MLALPLLYFCLFHKTMKLHSLSLPLPLISLAWPHPLPLAERGVTTRDYLVGYIIFSPNISTWCHEINSHEIEPWNHPGVLFKALILLVKNYTQLYVHIVSLARLSRSLRD